MIFMSLQQLSKAEIYECRTSARDISQCLAFCEDALGLEFCFEGSPVDTRELKSKLERDLFSSKVEGEISTIKGSFISRNAESTSPEDFYLSYGLFSDENRRIHPFYCLVLGSKPSSRVVLSRDELNQKPVLDMTKPEPVFGSNCYLLGILASSLQERHTY